MAKKITELNPAADVASVDAFPVVDDPAGAAETKKATGQQVAAMTVGLGNLVNTHANRPAAGMAGRRFYPTDGTSEFIDTGSEWRPNLNGTLGKQPPAASNWTVVAASGVSGTSFADQAGALALTWSTNAGGVGAPFRFAYKSAPALGASGYRVTAHLNPVYPFNTPTGHEFLFGMGWRNSSSGSIEVFEWDAQTLGNTGSHKTYPIRRRFTASDTGATPTFSFNELVTGEGSPPFQGIWLRLERTTAGNRTFYVSPNGKNWRELVQFTSATNAFFTPDQILLCATVWGDNAGSPRLQGVVYDSYEEESF